MRGTFAGNGLLESLHNVACSSDAKPLALNLTRILGQATFHEYFSNAPGEIIGRHEVASIRLDEFPPMLALPKIDLMKIDVEGHELQVVQGCEKLLAKGMIANLIIEISPYYLKCQHRKIGDIVDFLISFHLHGSWIDGRQLRPIDLATGETRNYLFRLNATPA